MITLKFLFPWQVVWSLVSTVRAISCNSGATVSNSRVLSFKSGIPFHYHPLLIMNSPPSVEAPALKLINRPESWKGKVWCTLTQGDHPWWYFSLCAHGSVWVGVIYPFRLQNPIYLYIPSECGTHIFWVFVHFIRRHFTHTGISRVFQVIYRIWSVIAFVFRSPVLITSKKGCPY